MGHDMAAAGRGSVAPRPGSLDWELLVPTLGPGAARLLACSGASTSASLGRGSADEGARGGDDGSGAPREVVGQVSGDGTTALPSAPEHPGSSWEMLQLIRRGRCLEALMTPAAQALLHWPTRQEAPTPLLPPEEEEHRNSGSSGTSTSGNGMQHSIDSQGTEGRGEGTASVEREAEVYLQCVRLRVSLLLHQSRKHPLADAASGPTPLSHQGQGGGVQEPGPGGVGSTLAALDVPCARWGVTSCGTGTPSQGQSVEGAFGQECEGERVVLLAGVACLLLFTQANVTGPFPCGIPPFPTSTERDARREDKGSAGEGPHEVTAQAGRPSCSCLKAFPLRGLLAAPGPECQVEPEPSTSGRPEGQEPEQAQSGHAGAASEAAAVEQWATSELMACADGTDIVGTCRLPQYLLLARELLQVAGQACSTPVSKGLLLDVSGVTLGGGSGHPGHRGTRESSGATGQGAEDGGEGGGRVHHGPQCSCPADWSWQWWGTRALLCHQRMLAERSPSLRAALLRSCPPLLRSMDALREGHSSTGGLSWGEGEARLVDEACAGAYVEVGLMELAYAHVDSARHLFEAAGHRVGVKGVEITGALGYRTIHQVDPKPQLVLQVQRMPLPGCSAAQSLENGAGCGPEGEVHEEILTKGVGNAQRPSSDFDGESDILLVPRLVGAQGASSPQTSPSAQNGHAIGNGTSTGHGDEAGSGGSGRPGQGLQRLKPVEQLVVLAFGSAAVKSAPHDEMRGWEVAPFVEAICAQPLETVPFMLRSAAALQRVRWERGRLHTRQRALAAMAEVVAAQEEDPRHAGQGAKEDNTQGTAQGKGQEVEALFLERLPYALSVWFPLSCALSKEYGELLLSCGYVGEALGVFEEHQQWESVILCYTLLSKSSAASALIHSRLRLFPNDPRLWCSLGDLNNDAECYQKAWQVSKGRFGRAQRALARLAQNRKDFAGAVEHWDLALRINPLHPSGWFSLGYAAMQEGNVGKALHAFTRSVQIDPENGESWNNIAALNMRRHRFPEALTALQEGLKYKADSWHMWENLAQVALEVAHRTAAQGRSSGTQQNQEHQELVLLAQALRAADKAWGLSKSRKTDLAVLGRLVQEVERWRGTGATQRVGQAGAQEKVQAPFPEGDEEDEWAEMPNAMAALLQPIQLESATGPSYNGTGALDSIPEGHPPPAADNVLKGGQEAAGGWEQRQRAQVESDLRRLLSQVVTSGCAGAEAWALQGRLLQALGDNAGAVEAFLKHVRGLQGNGWQHDRDKFQAFADASLEMAEACLCTARKYKRGGPTGVQAVESQEMQQTPEKQEGKDVLRWLASTRMHLRSIVKQATPHAGVPQFQQLQEKLEDVSKTKDALSA